MIVVGESVYKDCAQTVDYMGAPLACPFQRPLTRQTWCRQCLLAKIRSLEEALRIISERAAHEAANGY